MNLLKDNREVKTSLILAMGWVTEPSSEKKLPAHFSTDLTPTRTDQSGMAVTGVIGSWKDGDRALPYELVRSL